MGTLFYRIMGASMFDAGTFEAIEADRNATLQAAIVVLASSFAGAVAVTSSATPRVPLIGLFMAVAVVAWLGWVALVLQLGGGQLRRPETTVDFGELVRTTGFASAPGILQIFAVIPGVSTPIFIVTWVWMLAAMLMAVKHALDFQNPWRAGLVCTVALGLIVATLLLLTRVMSGVAG